MDKVESAMRIALAFREAFNKHDIENMLQLFSNDCIIETQHPAPDGISIRGKEALRQYWEDIFDAHNNLHMNIEEIFGFGERCIMRWQIFWINANGEDAHLRGIDVFQTSNDCIIKKYAYAKSGNFV